MINLNERIIVALDVDNAQKALSIVDSIGNDVIYYKVGHQLFTAEGPSIVKELLRRGKKVFLDLKLHEITNSVTAAIHEAGKLGVSIVTVHGLGGRKLLEAATTAASKYSDMKIFALTAVTGLTDEDLQEIGFTLSREELVLKLAKLAKSAGCHGVIASPKEAHLIKNEIGNNFLIVTPAIKVSNSASQDQQTDLTPQEAIKAGVTQLIIGRSVVDAENPREICEKILREIAGE